MEVIDLKIYLNRAVKPAFDPKNVVFLLKLFGDLIYSEVYELPRKEGFKLLRTLNKLPLYNIRITYQYYPSFFNML